MTEDCSVFRVKPPCQSETSVFVAETYHPVRGNYQLRASANKDIPLSSCCKKLIKLRLLQIK